MQFIVLNANSYFDLGRKFGELYKANNLDILNFKFRNKLYKKQIQVYKLYYPELLKELEGIAIASDFDFERLFYTFLCDEILYYQKLLTSYHKKYIRNKACSIFGYKTNNTVCIGRNYDWLPVVENFFQIYKLKNDSSFSFYGISHMSIANTKKFHLIIIFSN